ncbi:MAG TPA: hypothetical protein VHJ78_05570, partial [Actinomycetota bacterium]|nr:hypothetical protein [Actinomycetota bacterium]
PAGHERHSMRVVFRNNYYVPVWIAVMSYDPGSCGSYGNWRTQGWWNAGPGTEVHPISTTNRYVCFYAEGDDGAQWSGIYGPMYVYWDGFDSCINIGSTAAYATVGTQLVDLGSNAWMPWATHTVHLNP